VLDVREGGGPDHLEQTGDDEQDPSHDELLSPSLHLPVRDTLVGSGS
jgi:hypothetical protein